MRRNLRGQPKLRFHMIAFGIKTEINTFEDNNYFRNFLFIIPKVFLFKIVGSDFQPILKVAP